MIWKLGPSFCFVKVLNMDDIGQEFNNERGRLVAYEFKDLDFVPRRIYIIDSVPQNEKRGLHAHKKLHQYIVALKGSFDVKLIYPSGDNELFNLSSAKMGLRIYPYTWRELSNFSDDSVCLVFASLEYDETDYIWSLKELNKYA